MSFITKCNLYNKIHTLVADLRVQPSMSIPTRRMLTLIGTPHTEEGSNGMTRRMFKERDNFIDLKFEFSYVFAN